MYIDVVGSQLYILEVIFLFLLPPIVFSLRGRPEVLTVAVLLAGWLLAQFVADMMVGTDGLVAARKLSSIGLFGVLVIGLAYFIDRPSRAVSGLTGLLMGQITSSALQPNQFVDVDVWKFGVGPAVTLLGALSLSPLYARGQRWIVVCGLLGLSWLNFALGFRSMGAICIMTLFLVGLRRLRPVGGLRILRFSLGFAVALATISWAYQEAALHGDFGSTAQAKMERQAGSLGPIPGGRKELFFTSTAIMDSPFVGRGSDPRLTLSEKLEIRSRVGALGYEWTPVDDATYLSDTTLPTHSALFGAWVTAGLAGLLPWLYIFRIFFRGAMGVSANYRPLYPVICLLALLGGWNVLFSPFGGPIRGLMAISVVVVAAAASPKRAPAVQGMDRTHG